MGQWGITYLPTQDGWLYLAVVVDLFSRKIVGWAMASIMETSLVATALTMAIGRRHLPPGLLHHSDRGSQYASQAYQALLQRHEMVGRMSRRGNCWDNAVVERVFRSVKHEGLDDTAKKQLTRSKPRSSTIWKCFIIVIGYTPRWAT